MAILAYVVIKIIVHAVRFKYFYRRRINTIRTIISNFRKGRFISNEDPLPVNDEISDIYNQLFVLGKYLDSLFSSQNEEINKFRELYNNIVFSVSAYFVVLNEKDEVLFANESFCKNFQYSVNEITGQKITDLFFFSGGRIGEALEEVKKTGEAVILRQSRLFRFFTNGK